MTIYEATFPRKSQAGLILLGSESGPGSTSTASARQWKINKE